MEASRELVRLRDDLEGAAESLHQGGQDQVGAQGRQILASEPSVKEPELGPHEVEGSRLDGA